jgi:hypothetical protein
MNATTVRVEVPVPGLGPVRAERQLATSSQRGMVTIALLAREGRAEPHGRWHEHALHLPSEALAPLMHALRVLLEAGGREPMPTELSDL